MTPDDVAYPSLRSQLGLEWTGEFAHPTLVMGIVNVTPDSFQQVGRFTDLAAAVGHGLNLVDEGADILDIGGESTRPGASPVSTEEEIARVVPVVKTLSGACSVPISVDTRNAAVAERALDAGARIVNDVSAGRHDPRLLSVIAEWNAFLCVMHGPLDPRGMSWSTASCNESADLIGDIAAFLRGRVDCAVAAGVSESRVWVDPGFGFGKSVAGNLRILSEMSRLTHLGWPVLVGVSRKSTLGAVLGGVPPEQRLDATLAALALAVNGGASVLRVHDVKAAVQAVRLADAVVHGSATHNAHSA